MSALALNFAAIAGFGWLGESRDYANYLKAYDLITQSRFLGFSRFEPGYAFAAWFCKFRLGMDFPAFYGSLAAVSLGLKFRLFWRCTSAPVIASIVYLMLLYPLHEYTQIRASVAIALSFTGIERYFAEKRGCAIALVLAAASFHISAVVIIGAAVLVRVLRNRTPVLIIGGFSLLAGFSAYAIASVIRILAQVNPLASVYIGKAFLSERPTLLSGENILLFCLTVSSVLFLRPWRNKRDAVFFYLSFLAPVSYIAFLTIPAIAHRVSELFIFPYFLFTFRFDDAHQSRVPACFLVLTGVWMLYEAIRQGLITL